MDAGTGPSIATRESVAYFQDEQHPLVYTPSVEPAWVAWSKISHVFHGSRAIVSQRRSEHLQSRSEQHVCLCGPVRGHCRDRARLVGYGGRLAWVGLGLGIGLRSGL